jgi:hypothetical protein
VSAPIWNVPVWIGEISSMLIKKLFAASPDLFHSSLSICPSPNVALCSQEKLSNSSSYRLACLYHVFYQPSCVFCLRWCALLAPIALGLPLAARTLPETSRAHVLVRWQSTPAESDSDAKRIAHDRFWSTAAPVVGGVSYLAGWAMGNFGKNTKTQNDILAEQQTYTADAGRTHGAPRRRRCAPRAAAAAQRGARRATTSEGDAPPAARHAGAQGLPNVRGGRRQRTICHPLYVRLQLGAVSANMGVVLRLACPFGHSSLFSFPLHVCLKRHPLSQVSGVPSLAEFDGKDFHFTLQRALADGVVKSRAHIAALTVRARGGRRFFQC